FPGRALRRYLKFRQSQRCVMPPMLMQAIKLLQLSNLDLSAFVEEELERNPLLERASDNAEPPVAGESVPERADYSDQGEGVDGHSDEFGPGLSDTLNGSAEGFEPGQEEWLSRGL